MILQIASAIIFIFVSVNLFYKTNLPTSLKILGCALILFVSMKYAVYHFLGGAFFSPDLPRSFILVMEALYGALILLFFLLVFWDLYLAGNWIMAKAGFPVPRHIPAGVIKSIIVLVAICLGAWGTWESVRVPQARIVEMRVAGLPPELENTSIVQLSDLHIGPLLKKDWLEEVVNKANSLEPDIIVLTGDYVDGHVSQLETELEPLAYLKSKYGVFGVTGNHEYYWNAAEWVRALEKLRIVMLDNEHKIVTINGQTLVIAGVPDLVAERFGFSRPNLEQALHGAPQAIKVLLAHQPKLLPETLGKVDIQLSGHTHGGLMFFLQPLIARFNNGFVEGLYELNGKNAYVNPGTGLWNGFSSRVGVPSEITKIILKAA